MNIVRSQLLALSAIAFVLVLNAYVYLYNTFSGLGSGSKILSANECADTQGSIENPNKTFFISCGGFLE